MLTFGSIMKQNAEKFKDKPAVIFKEKQLTYSELNKRANQIASAFLCLGYKKGDKVSVMMKNHSAYVEIITGLAKIGVIIVPINFRLVGSEIEYIVLNSESRGFITTGEYAEEIEKLLPRLPQLDTVVVVDGSPASSMIDYESFLARGTVNEPNIQIDKKDTDHVQLPGQS
jgi:long-chain acyl-CoA synthetase